MIFICVDCTNGGGNDNAAATPHWVFVGST